MQRVGLAQVVLAHTECHDVLELKQLAISAGLSYVVTLNCQREVPDSKYYIGSGKVDQWRDEVTAEQLDIIIFNNDLSPSQQRNLEKALCCRVIDRTEIILDIFAQRARTFEGKLQVELAQLQRLSTRLIRGWTHLERQKGGIGLRGPGETQLETDRRLIRERIKAIQKKLAKVSQQRKIGRRSRVKQGVPTIALVGYTNVGKSSLFNVLSQAKVYAQDQLFATLDPTVRRITLPSFGEVVIADTVGFIQGLPHQLVMAFKATLEEVTQADLLLHVVDASDARRQTQIAKVEEVLQEIGAQDVPAIIVNNKIDLLEDACPRVQDASDGSPAKVWVSVNRELGLDELRQAMSAALLGSMVHCCIRIPVAQTRLRAWLYEKVIVQKESVAENGDYLLEVKMGQEAFEYISQSLSE